MVILMEPNYDIKKGNSMLINPLILEIFLVSSAVIIFHTWQAVHIGFELKIRSLWKDKYNSWWFSRKNEICLKSQTLWVLAYGKNLILLTSHSHLQSDRPKDKNISSWNFKIVTNWNFSPLWYASKGSTSACNRRLRDLNIFWAIQQFWGNLTFNGYVACLYPSHGC